MRNFLIRLFGWKALIYHGDPTVVDRWRWLQRFLRPGALRTLDAGCGSGMFTFFASSMGNEAIGVSFGQREVALATERARMIGASQVRFLARDLTKLDEVAEELGKFDQIICFEMIEHIPDDSSMVQGLASLLNPGGVLLVTTPSTDHRPLYGEEDLNSPEYAQGHVRWGYSTDDLSKLMEAAGLEVFARDLLSGVVSQRLASLTFRLRRLGSSLAWAVVLPLRVLRVLDVPLSRFLRFPYLSVAVAGRRAPDRG